MSTNARTASRNRHGQGLGPGRSWYRDQAVIDPREGEHPQPLCELCGTNPRKQRGNRPAYRFCTPCLTQHGGTEGARDASRHRKATLRTAADATTTDTELADINHFYNNWPIQGTQAEHDERLTRHRARIANIHAA